jgi:D-amino-acid dehydrogenase
MVVVGAGIIGVATACVLTQEGWEVTLLAPEAVGEGGAALGSAGLFATQTVQPLGMPGVVRGIPRMLLDKDAPLSIRWRYAPRFLPWFLRFLRASRPTEVERLSHALRDMLDQSYEAYAPLLDAADAHDLVRRDGLVTVYRTAEQLGAARPDIELRKRRGVELQLVSGDDLRRLVPAVSPDYEHGVFYPKCGHTTDPRALLLALWRSVERSGGTFVKDTAVGFDIRGRSVAAVRTRSAAVPADAVVIAAGAWSKPLTRALGLRVPLDTERGYHVTLADAGIELPVPIIVGDVRFAVTPMTMGVRLAGTVEFAGLRAPPNQRRQDMLVRLARRCFPGLRTDRQSRWMGFRPALPDSLPVIGRSPQHSNVYFGFGHGHLGVTGGAITGKIIADLAAGRPPQIDVAPFRVDRF